MVVFFCPDILIYSLVLTAISRKMNTTELTNLTEHVVYLMLLYSKALVLGNTLLCKAGLKSLLGLAPPMTSCEQFWKSHASVVSS